MTRYTYGDSELAGERLTIVAELFGPASAAFLRAAAPERPRLAVDLGCGPGHTTRLMHEVTGAERTVGLDRSPAFVAEASADAPPDVTFLEHDATAMPLPVREPDLIFARLLLAHLPDPASIVAAWCQELAPGGRLLIDEVETVETDDPVMRTYLDEVAIPVVASQGGRLIVGPELHAMDDPPVGVRVHDQVATLEPQVALTARMFGMNLRVLAAAAEIERRPDLEEGLAALERDPGALPVTWRMRQLAFQRRG